MKKKIFGIISLIIGITLVFAFTAMSLTGCKNPGGDPVLPPDVTYTAIQYGGIDGKEDSTGIVFTFSESVSSLTAANITVGGAAEKGEGATLNGSRNVWTLSPINVSAAGLVTVSIEKKGIDAMEQNVIVHKEGEATPQYWSVTWNLNGGAAGTGEYPTLIVRDTVLARPSPDPAKASAYFINWYTDSELTQVYNFASNVTANINLYAKWEAIVKTITLGLDGNDNWSASYDVPSSVTGGKITAGDEYTFTYSFRSNVDITGDLTIGLVDPSQSWNMLSDYESIGNKISANTAVSGTVILHAAKTASSTAAAANKMVFVIYSSSNAAGQPTLNFTDFSLEKTGRAAETFTLGLDGNKNWVGVYDIPSSVTGGKITAGDEYTFNYSFRSNVDITGNLYIHLVDQSAGWTELSSYSTIASNISANTAVSGTVTFTATKTAASTAAAANRLVFIVYPGSNAASAPTLIFTDFSLVKVVSTPTAPTITTTSLADGTAGTAYSQTLTATGTAPITWSIDTGDLPNGVSLSSAGVISGTPTTADTFNFTVKAANAVSSDTKALSIVIGSGGGDPGAPYIITGSGSSFTATKNSATVGTANQSIQNVLNDIRASANGNDFAIQLGNGTNVLDIGTESMTFQGLWGGKITLSGKITSGGSSSTITLWNDANIISTADITATGTNDAITIYKGEDSNSLIINGGTISSLSHTISNTGTLTINSGTVSTTSAADTSAYAIANHGTLTINGGSINATVKSGGTLYIGSTSTSTTIYRNNATFEPALPDSAYGSKEKITYIPAF